MSIVVQVGVAYGSDLAKVERVTLEVAREVMTTAQGAVRPHEPFIRFHTFGESAINFSVILRGNHFTDQYLVKHEFVRLLHDRYAQEGISIPFPIRTLSTGEPIKVHVMTGTTGAPGATSARGTGAAGTTGAPGGMGAPESPDATSASGGGWTQAAASRGDAAASGYRPPGS